MTQARAGRRRRGAARDSAWRRGRVLGPRPRHAPLAHARTHARTVAVTHARTRARAHTHTHKHTHKHTLSVGPTRRLRVLLDSEAGTVVGLQLLFIGRRHPQAETKAPGAAPGPGRDWKAPPGGGRNCDSGCCRGGLRPVTNAALYQYLRLLLELTVPMPYCYWFSR